MKLIVNLYSRGLLLVAALLLCTASFAQRTITGTVTDAQNGEPLIGANVLVAGTSSGTITDFDGTYSLDVPEGYTELEFSYTGYKAQKVTIGASGVIDVALAAGEVLDEVVVIGYGSVKKEDATGSLTAVGNEDFNKGALVSAENLITGKVAGVQITPSATPGGGGNIRIRGGTTTGNNAPLIVIDGVPVGNGANLAFYVSPSDVETFTVLKDASATAIYGSRGANGVIMVTTKRGSKGSKPRFTYNGFASFASPTKSLPVLSPAEFRNVVTFVAPNRIEDIGPERTDWFEEISRETTFGQNHDLAVSGGGENFAYRISTNYQKVEGVVRPYEAERIGFGLALDLSLLNDQLNIAANVKANFNERINDLGAIGNAWTFDPTQPVLDLNNTAFGGYFEYGEALTPRNPVSTIEQQNSIFQEFGSISNLEFEYTPDFIPGLSGKVNFGYDIDNNNNRFFSPTTYTNLLVGNRNGSININDGRFVNLLFDAYLNYKFDVGTNQNFDITAGYSYQDFTTTGNNIDAFNIDTDIFGFNSLAPATMFESTSFEVDNRLIGVFGRLQYSLLDRYLLTLTVRRDGSSRFGEENRWGTFPSAALGWRILQEPFAAGLANTFSDLKLRVGYGITGNQEIGDFQFLPVYQVSDLRARYQFGDQFVSSIRPNGYDAGLKWEETTQFNVGLDFGFSNGRINGTIEYYYKKTDDLLFTVNVPAGTNLTDRVLTNIGELENQGVELTLNATILTDSEFTWDLGFNASYNQNEIVSVDGSAGGVLTGGIQGGVGNTVQVLRAGFPFQSFLLFDHKLDANGNPLVDDVDHNEDGVVDLADMYEDLNADGIVNDQDRRPIENPLPDVIMGLTSNMYYKNFDLSFTLRANIGNFVYNNNASALGFYNLLDIRPSHLNNLHVSVLQTGFNNPQFFSDVYLEDASFVRLDNITLGYTFPNLPDGLSLRLYGTAENWFVLTEYGGLDPEFVNGIDNNAYPRQKRFVFGATLGF